MGTTNVLVATAVAEEGLDICHCSLIIRFNLPPTARQFIQSRGRARAPNSDMVLMIETGNHNHQKLVEDALRYNSAHDTLLDFQIRDLAGLQGTDHNMVILQSADQQLYKKMLRILMTFMIHGDDSDVLRLSCSCLRISSILYFLASLAGSNCLTLQAVIAISLGRDDL